MDAHVCRRPVRGFSLIEIAVVLFIIGLVTGGIVALLNSMVGNRQIEATRTRQEAIKTNLISFIARNNRMPCPAPSTSSDGAEGVTPGTCTGVSSSGTGVSTVVTGMVPWASLGLPEETALDAYNNRFTYQVVRASTGLNSVTISGMTGWITIHRNGPGAAGNQVNDCSGGATINPCAAVAVIVSHGKDGFGGYTRFGVQIPFSSNVTGDDEKENADGDSKFVVKDFSDIASNPFDDSVMALTATDLLSPLITSGVLKDYRAILNAKIDVLKGAVIAASYEAGGISWSGDRYYSLPSALPSVSSDQKKDPWNNDIAYTRSTTSITCSSNSSQQAFSMASSGPDGVSGNADDITYSILTGEIISIISKAGCND